MKGSEDVVPAGSKMEVAKDIQPLMQCQEIYNFIVQMFLSAIWC